MAVSRGVGRGRLGGVNKNEDYEIHTGWIKANRESISSHSRCSLSGGRVGGARIHSLLCHEDSHSDGQRHWLTPLVRHFKVLRLWGDDVCCSPFLGYRLTGHGSRKHPALAYNPSFGVVRGWDLGQAVRHLRGEAGC